MTGEIPKEVLYHVLDALPTEISFIDADNTVRYFSKDGERVFKRPKSIIGRKVQDCHPKKSLDKVNEILESFRQNRRDVAQFWIDHHERKILIRYVAVRDANGEYLGTLEASEDITELQKLEGEKRLV
ncbi:MAG: PAS domain-containing protein [Methermicoccaceae archaeon]